MTGSRPFREVKLRRILDGVARLLVEAGLLEDMGCKDIWPRRQLAIDASASCTGIANSIFVSRSGGTPGRGSRSRLTLWVAMLRPLRLPFFGLGVVRIPGIPPVPGVSMLMPPLFFIVFPDLAQARL